MNKLRTTLHKVKHRIKSTLNTKEASVDIDDYVRAISQAFYTNKNFVNFIKSPYKPLTITLDRPVKLQSLRLSLNSSEFLHIHSIALLDERGQRIKIPAETAEISASSYYADTGQNEMNQRLLQPSGKHSWAIHTNRDKSPWIKVSLTKPLLVSAITIKNRQDVNALRTASLQVDIQTPTQHSWKTILLSDQLGLEAVRKDYGLDKVSDGQYVHQAIAYAIIGDYVAAHKSFRHVPAPLRSTLLQAVNHHILAAFELEWSSNHGIRRTFRFWKLPEKRRFIKMTSNVVSDLQSLSKDVSLGFGSAMAAVRDRDLIPHDDDTDIMIAFRPSQAASFKEAKLLVKEHLEKHGYELTGDFFNHWHVRRDGLKADVFVGIYESDGTIGWYPHPRGILKRSDMFPAKSVKLLGIPCLIPHDAERFLSVIYGDTWRVPDPTWAPKWDEKKYADLA
ncbi:MAG TPA: discoidin domain-containing protein [Candidatus Saccharimonadales bacterium]